MAGKGDKTIGIEKNWMELLCAWFMAGHRELPWRNLKQPNPYYVWISEIMLQQTRVEAVKTYFCRFIDRLPDVYALAEVSDDELMKLWQGLGYYSRARNLKKCAQILVAEHGGVLPNDRQALLRLPGIGNYTAGAILSIAYHQPYAAVDGNALRVMSRLTGCKEDIAKEKTKQMWSRRMDQMLQENTLDCSVINQAIMELGAIVCIPNKTPDCLACPLEHICEARKENDMLKYPVKTTAKKRRQERRAVFLVHQQGKVLLHKRPQKGLLAGLYEFPNCICKKETKECTDEKIHQPISKDEAVRNLQKQQHLHIEKENLRVGKRAHHVFSHIEWHMQSFEVASLVDRKLPDDHWVWADARELREIYAIPSAFSAYVEQIYQLLEKERE